MKRKKKEEEGEKAGRKEGKKERASIGWLLCFLLSKDSSPSPEEAFPKRRSFRSFPAGWLARGKGGEGGSVSGENERWWS